MLTGEANDFVDIHYECQAEVEKGNNVMEMSKADSNRVDMTLLRKTLK